MFFPCSIKGCKKPSTMQCTCSGKFLFCFNHIGLHSYKSGCNSINISKEISENETKLNNFKKVLTSEREKLIKIAFEMISEIQKFLNYGLSYIDEQKKIVDKMINTYNHQDLNNIIQNFKPIKYRRDEFIRIIEDTLAVFNLNSKRYLAMFTGKSLEQKKNLLLNFRFEDFDNITKIPKSSIEYIEITNDKKYVFVCKL